IIHGAIVNAATGDHLTRNAGNLRDLGRNRKTRIFEPLPASENLVDPPALAVVFEQANAQLDDFVTRGIRAGGFDIYYGGYKLRNVIGWVVFGQRLQSTGDTIITAFDERPSHLLQCWVHFPDMGRLALN